MSRTAGPPPTLAGLREVFDARLEHAAACGEPTPSCSSLHPAVVDAVDNVTGRVAPRVGS